VKEQYSELFQCLIKAYYNGRLEEKVTELFEEENIERALSCCYF